MPFTAEEAQSYLDNIYIPKAVNRNSQKRAPSSQQNGALSPQQKTVPAKEMLRCRATERCARTTRKRIRKSNVKKMRQSACNAHVGTQRAPAQMNKVCKEFARRELLRREHETRVREQTRRAIEETKLIARHLTLNETKNGFPAKAWSKKTNRWVTAWVVPKCKDSDDATVIVHYLLAPDDTGAAEMHKNSNDLAIFWT